MKTIIGALLAAGLLAAAPAHADSDWRVKAGMMSLEDDDSAATNVGVVYAMDFAGIIGAEFEVNTSIADGEYDLGGFGTADHSVLQGGAYATLTTPGPIYFKAKAGLVYNDAEIAGVSDSSVGEALGIGVGFTFVEIEYTRSKVDFQGTDIDVDFISASFGF